MTRTVRAFACFLLILLPLSSVAQWKQTFSTDFSRDLASIGTLVFAGTGSGVAMLADSGAHWSRTSLSGQYINAVIARGSRLFAAVQSKVYLSADSGATWALITNGLPSNVYVDVLATDGVLVFAGTTAHGLYITQDDGAHWVHASIPLLLQSVMAISVDGSRIFAATGDGVFRSTDHGQTWVSANAGLPGTLGDLARHDSTLYGCSSYLGKVFLSRDQGNTWVAACSLSTVFTITCAGNALIMGTSSSGIFATDNDGASIHPINEGLAAGNIWTVEVIGGYLFAGGPGVWRRPVTEVATIMTGVEGDVPRSVPLVRNFPNPFNAATTITFDLPTSCAVSLTVYDRLGREVAALFRGTLQSGAHAFVWTADHVASGLYYYRLAYGGTVLTGKALLLK